MSEVGDLRNTITANNVLTYEMRISYWLVDLSCRGMPAASQARQQSGTLTTIMTILYSVLTLCGAVIFSWFLTKWVLDTHL